MGGVPYACLVLEKLPMTEPTCGYPKQAFTIQNKGSLFFHSSIVGGLCLL